MEQICSVSGEAFRISPAEQEYCAKHQIPLRSLSSRECLRNMLVFRNRPFLYNAVCGLTDKKILSSVPPESELIVYDIEAWLSDSWDPLTYGRDYDFRRPFFKQFADLYRLVPQKNLSIFPPLQENSDYTNGITGAKNCYLLFAASFNEDCLVSYAVWRSKNIVDSTFVSDSELCYDCTDITNCYNTKFSGHSVNCADAYFLDNCQACKNCYGCVNLNHKEFHFYNQALSKADYANRVAGIDLGDHSVLEEERKKFTEFSASFPTRSYFGKRNEASTGNYINNTKNCSDSYFVSNSEDVVDSLFLDNAKSSILHAMFGNKSELVYHSVTVGDDAYDVRFSFDCWPSPQALEYCGSCGNGGTSHCFGSLGLKRLSYCILNKQYTKDEYFSLLPRIKAHMLSTGEYGKFFPPELSPFYYNQSDAGYYLPLSKAEAERRHFKWKDDDLFPAVQPARPPENIRAVSDDILKQVFQCEESGKAFRVSKAEVEFLKRNNLALPRLAPLQRIRRKLSFFEISPLQEIRCGRCQKAVPSVYSQTARPILCEDCFRSEVY